VDSALISTSLNCMKIREFDCYNLRLALYGHTDASKKSDGLERRHCVNIFMTVMALVYSLCQ
jgi:hypothetical protein